MISKFYGAFWSVNFVKILAVTAIVEKFAKIRTLWENAGQKNPAL